MRISHLEPLPIPMTLEDLETRSFSHILFLINRKPATVSNLISSHLSWDDIDVVRSEYSNEVDWLEQVHGMKIAFLFMMGTDRRRDIISIMEDLVEDGHTFSSWTTAQIFEANYTDVLYKPLARPDRIGLLFFSSESDATLFRMRFTEFNHHR